ncbi:hypothetical protein B4109_1239 [Geobacillus stearothermophilus]|uniref:Uncharacterized protein n=1 Tax=Geobacillus stearothermophilus TaxID=1422 RepID=A0A150MRA0_GEOSE|nr:hypothetical protein B4109_1239 [Geobacillus stearothermophilus]
MAFYAKTPGRHLFDRAAAPVAVVVFHIAGRVFAALAAVAFSADPVHGDRQSLMGFLADRTERHGPCFKAADDRFNRLDFVNRHRRALRIEVEQVAQKRQLFFIGQFRILFIEVVIVFPARPLQQMDRLRIEHVMFAVAPPLQLAACIEHIVFMPRSESGFVAHFRFFRNFRKPDAADLRCRAGEVFLNDIVADADRFKNLRAAVALHRRNAHFRHHFDNAVNGCLHIRFHRFAVRQGDRAVF